jgi:radical SAM superfamily enzyme YgiQ (UPF0313 family)
MHVALWDTRKQGIAKDFAGGYGVGMYAGAGGLPGRLIRHAFRRDRRPVALAFAYLAAIARQLGHTVEYYVDRLPADADVVIFHPALATLHVERQAIARLLERRPPPRVLVTGPLARALPEAFAGLEVTRVEGEAERLFWQWDEVLAHGPGAIQVGSVARLDDLPLPDWSLFQPRRFRVGYDFWRFPTAYIQQSRGCTLGCDYCPYIAWDNTTRFRDPQCVAEEMRQGMRDHGFQSFKFRDPLFGLDRDRTMRLAELIGELPGRVQFSIESRLDLLPAELLVALRRVGLTSVTFGIERPDVATLRAHRRAPIGDDRQRAFIELCRRLDIRTVAGFLLGFPHDTGSTIRAVARYAQSLNPTYANFNIVTPYPGTRFFDDVRGQIASFDYSRYDVYTPVLEYEHLTHAEVTALHAKAFVGFYFRWKYARDNLRLLWPRLGRLVPQSRPEMEPPQSARAA